MTPQQSYLIRKSFRQVEEHRHIAALVFYRRLFAIDPELRPLFKTDIEVQAQKLTDMLAALIAMLERPGQLETELREMGLRHRTYGVQDAHYRTVGEALLGMLAEVCGPVFTPEVREAWSVLYGMVQSLMRSAPAESAVAAV